MTNLKTTRRALFSSIIALFICFTMLLGTTFAWFTDSAISAGNIIQTGTLDIEMEWKDATANGAQQTYKDASKGAIFNYDNWEPGCVEAKNIKISNVGTLALKYHLNIAANGEVSKLSDVIDVYYAEGEYVLTDRNVSDLTKIGTLTSVLEGMPTNMAGDLEANTSDTVTIALKMQEDAGNEYQGLSIGTNFSVILMATQDNVEKDAFDENYDDIEIPEISIQTIDGVSYATTIDGEYVMISVDDYTLTSFTVNENVTVLGTGNGVNDNDRVFGKNAPLTSLTLPEGLTEIKDNALNALPNLTTVNLPSTLKAIGIQSFRQTGMSEITVPASVETVKLGAFRDMANLTTVTVEGNVAFDNYAFRSCPNLTSIYLLGDDVTFTGSQFATHTDSGACNAHANCPGLITIYVKNATVAARVIAAQGTSSCYEVKILGEEADGSDAGTVAQVSTDTAFDEAIIGGDTAVILKAGSYTLPNGGDGAYLQGKELTVIGTKGTVIDVSNVDARDQFVTGAILSFEGVTLNFGYENYMGFANAESLTYKNCTLTGLQFLYCDNVTFENCVIDSSANTKEPHGVWTYGAENVSFTDCDFIYGNRAVNCYNDNDVDGGKQVVNFTNCTFTTTATDSEGAIEINSCFFSVGIEVNVEGYTAPAYGELAYVSQWDSTNGAKTTINIK